MTDARSRVALFGGGGFVGSNLAYRLRDHEGLGATVVDLDDAKLRLRFENEPYAFVRCDVERDEALVDEIVAGHDAVVQLVARVQPRRFIADPVGVAQITLFETLKIVEACARHNTRLVHFSTSEVYGKSLGREAPFNEDTSDLVLGSISKHRWIYSCAKQMLDRIIHARGLAGELEYAIVRPFNFMGPLMDWLPGQDDGPDDVPRVFAGFMGALFDGRPMRLVGGGLSRRCFTYVEDGVSALERILERPAEARNTIFNIGNPASETSIRGLAGLMARLWVEDFGRPPPPPPETVDGEAFYGPGYEDCDRRLPDVGHITALGWAPRYGLEETVRTSMAYAIDNESRLRHLAAAE